MAFKTKPAVAPQTVVSLIKKKNIKLESMFKNGMSPEDAFNIQQETRPSIGIDPEGEFSNIIEQEIHALNGTTPQDRMKSEHNSDIDFDLYTGGGLESYTTFKREDAPSPIDDNTAETNLLSDTISQSPHNYGTRVLMSPTPDVLTSPTLCTFGQANNGSILSTPLRPAASSYIPSLTFSESIMDLDVPTQALSVLENSKQYQYSAADAQTQTDPPTDPEPVARSHPNERMSLNEADPFIMDAYCRELAGRQTQRQAPPQYRVTKTVLKAAHTQAATPSHFGSTAQQQQHTTLRIKDKRTCIPRIILTAPQGMLPTLDLQGQTLKISLIKG
ncbi:hypothetical protein DL98DRAFT_583431 [Cadophora sp. DSE1049]|nr:hypothetical protein DL98DRAFT_583431 [Cadophora sp. DSE1049]